MARKFRKMFGNISADKRRLSKFLFIVSSIN